MLMGYVKTIFTSPVASLCSLSLFSLLFSRFKSKFVKIQAGLPCSSFFWRTPFAQLQVTLSQGAHQHDAIENERLTPSLSIT